MMEEEKVKLKKDDVVHTQAVHAYIILIILGVREPYSDDVE